ncbi:DUF262 domain-containing protein [Sphingomonas sp. MMSM20]|uniref:DUF262 domain-containing protein n=1 Tax=Sphingomonas lycopersici TaxID=2951807 RepID=UPI0022388EF2|nr:DUF262 domain-containing protein [Sphingomonas lycopersici]MCW6532223.1 DUF262 domain-containing protein [Sphingomonas lycopersici]
MSEEPEGPDFTDEIDAPPTAAEMDRFSQAVLFASDWTVETIVNQLERHNIEMNPAFQRRDAWSGRAKGKFVESVILGLPIPQIVLAERQGERGRYIVLDGKQRLLSLMQFTGKFNGHGNAFRLAGLEIRTDLSGKRYSNFESDLTLRDELNAFSNHTIRTVVIRNWPDLDFLHIVFLRLNTGSLKLSPQELRQAAIPGPFSDYVDTAASASQALRTILSRNSPDPRMRDVELLVRFLSFQNYLSTYQGRMKRFLDNSCERFNNDWIQRQQSVLAQVNEFENGVATLIDIFGSDGLARKTGSRSFNRAIFDALIFYASNPAIRTEMSQQPQAVRDAYGLVMQDDVFGEAVESDTAGVPHTHDRLAIWGNSLRAAIGLNFTIPALLDDPATGERQITFDGF